ncbi:hypothetical protein PsorP6_008180 [Peronosclerospora sorghi]|uniref:Uncharacterized protein n=1 Tax=Peronosclerospora sorghi TaxID=230839 RepID=A0ACC0W8K8_9STRA|nr:hypothetical protein PsorP6_008180 [Peronosclerospora sorghi]
MPYKLRGIAASKKRKLDVFISDETITPTRKCSHDWLHKKKSNKGPPEHEAEALPLVDTATTRFLELLKQDARRLPPSLPMRSKHGTDGTKCLLETHHVEFQLPFKQLEIKHLDERQWVRRPPPFGKISRCVYVSTKMPIADFPVHKCTCYEETHKSMTKRTTMMAKNVKAQRDLAVKGRHPFSRPADEEKDQVMVYCGEACYNRMLFISCSDDTCSVPDPSLCSNRAIKRREIKSVRVEYISGAGFGLIANSKIQAGNFIIEYVGEVIDNEECRRRMRKYQEQGEVSSALMDEESICV